MTLALAPPPRKDDLAVVRSQVALCKDPKLTRRARERADGAWRQSHGRQAISADAVQSVRENHRVRVAAACITRWLAQRLHAARDDVTLTLETALRCFWGSKRAAVRVQRCVLCFQQLNNQGSLVAQAARERDERVATLCHMARDLLVASRELRAFLGRRHATRRLHEVESAKRDRTLHEQAPVAIEGIALGFLGRR